ncbi:MAG TPA: NAD(P)/FAD-dependent oxidoreductase [Gemmatimonadaceae bacterium]|jgi:phytoene dehydrogenase-like protein
MSAHDAIVVGAGPNGLAAAIVLAHAGLSVLVIEGAPRIGGGARTEELTLPGFMHDVCSAVHPLAAASPLFAALPLADHGLEFIEPPIALAHPFDDAAPALLARDLGVTGRSLGVDADAYESLLGPLARAWQKLAIDVLAPLHIPKHPMLLARFAASGGQSVQRLVEHRFAGGQARGLIGGIAGHALQPFSHAGTAAIALMLAAAGHRVGWPIARGGARCIASALGSYFTKLGGQVETGTFVKSLDELPAARVVLLDLTPRQVLRVAERRLPSRYKRALGRFRYGPGVFKVDWALADAVPWRADECRQAGTLHLGGTIDELAANEAAVARGEHPERPTVLISQPTLFDTMRAPSGAHILWGYCHVPNGSTIDMLPRIEAQIERFAPGFRERVLARHVMTTADLEARNPNLVGGDIGEGANTLRQLFLRPVARWHPCRTPFKGLYLCSASTPPGGGVHGMCGYHAAKTALEDIFDIPIHKVIDINVRR